MPASRRDPEPLARLARVDWGAAGRALDERGHARLPGLLSAGECRRMLGLWDDEGRFRKHVDLARHRFGDRGCYRYFAHPLPPPVEALRRALYPPLARIANRWQERLGQAERFPPTLGGFLRRCRAAGQDRPTPLLLRYEAGGYNCLHQDRYGAVAFPLQVVVLLSEPGRDFEGGEFLLVEQRARSQSRGRALALGRGEAVVFPNDVRPVASARGFSRCHVRHGVSDLRSGHRATLGILFHDAA